MRIGRGSYVAAGSTITEDVPPESLALGRARQSNKEGWARTRSQAKPSVNITVREAGPVAVVELNGRLTLGPPVEALARPSAGSWRAEAGSSC